MALLTVDDSDAVRGTRTAAISFADGPMTVQVERLDGHSLSPAAGEDGFVILTLLPAMARGQDVHVHGSVSREVLRNAADWMSAWHQWRPDLYRPVSFTADHVVDGSPDLSGPVLSAFSGGVDGAFTAWRHLDGADGVRPRLSAVMLVQGGDIPHGDVHGFARARARAEKVLAGHGVPLIPIRVNAREIFPNWEHGHGTAIAGPMALLQDQFSQGLIGSTEDVGNLVLPWGSTPITDHLLSTGRFAVRQDGAGFSRTEKVAAIAGWAEAASNLRVCWEGDRSDRNCGHCEKCIRTILNFRAAGAGLPGCFDRDIAVSKVRGLRLRPVQLAEAQSILKFCRTHSVQASWVRALRAATWRARVRLAAEGPARRLLRR